METKDPIVTLKMGDRRLTLLGTAHVSKQSADTVTQLIDTGDYDAVAIELCDSRHKAIMDPDSLAKQDLLKVIREGKAPMVMASLALGAFQQRLADQFGIKPGAEMRAAMEGAEQHNLFIHLVDREIGTTLRRVYHSVPWWKRLGIFSGLISSVISKDKIEEKDIERLKEGDMLESTFDEFATESGELYEPLIDERDRFMALKIFEAIQLNEPDHMLAVMGAGHLKGTQKYLAELIKESPESAKIASRVEKLNELPVKTPIWRFIPWLIAGLVVVGFIIGFNRSPELGWDLVSTWVLVNGTLSAIGAAIALAHPLTILTAFVAAPITSLNPTIGAGMVAGAAELYFRKPQVEDFSQLRQDTSEMKGWWRNRVSRVLLVFLLSTLGSAAGTYIAGFQIFGKLTGG